MKNCCDYDQVSAWFMVSRALFSPVGIDSHYYRHPCPGGRHGSHRHRHHCFCHLCFVLGSLQSAAPACLSAFISLKVKF